MDGLKNRHTQLLVLTLGNFVIGVGVMVLPGMLNDVASGLEVSLSLAGQLIGVPSLLMALGAPLLASVTSQIDRRKLLVFALLLYGVGHLICALAPNYTLLLIVRTLTMLGAVIFTPQAAAAVGLLVPAEQRAAAVTSIFLGWSIASVVGMPLGNLLAGTFDWRVGFAFVGVLGLVAAWRVSALIPSGLFITPVSLAAWRQIMSHPSLLWILLVTLASAAGQFVLLSYISPSMLAITQSGAAVISAFMVGFGLAGLVGNLLMNRYVGRLGVERAVLVTVLLMTAGMCVWSLIAVSLKALAWPLLMMAMTLWGLGCFACNSAQQARLVAAAPVLASVSIALNTSCMYAGQAIGAGIGGPLLETMGLSALAPAGALILMLSVVLSWAASKRTLAAHA